MVALVALVALAVPPLAAGQDGEAPSLLVCPMEVRPWACERPCQCRACLPCAELS